MSLDLEGHAGDGAAAPADPMSRRAWLAATDEPAPDLQPQALVAALIDQLAAGQVETLHSLHSAAATVRRQTTELQTAAVAPVEQLEALLEQLKAVQTSLYSTAVEVISDVTLQLDEIVAQRVQSAKEVTAAPLEPLLALTRDLGVLQSTLHQATDPVVDDVTDRLAASLDAMVDQRLSRASERLAVNAGKAEAAMDAAAASVTERLASSVARAEAAMAAAADAAVEQLARANADSSSDLTAMTAVSAAAMTTAVDAAVEQIMRATADLDEAGSRVERSTQQTGTVLDETFTRLINNLVEVALENLEGVEHAGKSLLTRLDGQVEGFLGTLAQALEVQATRDAQVEVELSDRLRRLVDRTDVGVRRLSDRLRKETDRLAQRDEEQEYLRADSFVNALETLLARTDGRSHLRSRIMEVLGSERRKRDEPRAVAARPSAQPLEAYDDLDNFADFDDLDPAEPTPAPVLPKPAAVVRVRPPVKPLVVTAPAPEPISSKPAVAKPAAVKKPAPPRTAATKPAATKPAPVKKPATKAAAGSSTPTKRPVSAAAKASPPSLTAAVIAPARRPRTSATSKQEKTP